MNKKILQIINAPSNLRAIYKNSSEKDDILKTPVLCLALCEDEDRLRYVCAIDACSDGEIDFCESASNFAGFEYED